MRIVNQDKDIIVTLEDKDELYIEDKYYNDILFGTNIMFKGISGPILLGTFDIKEDAIQVKNEILNLFCKGFKDYSIPEDSLILLDIPKEG